MIISDDRALLDTNVLVYAADEQSPFHAACKDLRERGRRNEVALCVTPQVLFEFFAVITDARRVTRPIEPKDAAEQIRAYAQDRSIRMIHPDPDIEAAARLFERYHLKRQDIFDGLLVATMLANEVKMIYTYDTEHFTRFSEIRAARP